MKKLLIVLLMLTISVLGLTACATVNATETKPAAQSPSSNENDCCINDEDSEIPDCCSEPDFPEVADCCGE